MGEQINGYKVRGGRLISEKGWSLNFVCFFKDVHHSVIVISSSILLTTTPCTESDEELIICFGSFGKCGCFAWFWYIFCYYCYKGFKLWSRAVLVLKTLILQGTADKYGAIMVAMWFWRLEKSCCMRAQSRLQTTI